MNDPGIPGTRVLSLVGSWHSQALCKGKGDIWFSGQASDRAIAAQVCRSCPVRRECSEVAEAIGYDCRGTWGGIWRG